MGLLPLIRTNPFMALRNWITTLGQANARDVNSDLDRGYEAALLIQSLELEYYGDRPTRFPGLFLALLTVFGVNLIPRQKPRWWPVSVAAVTRP